jgi:hypothetical protein
MSSNIYAQNSEIIAIVEDTVITSSELKEMTKLMAYFTNQEQGGQQDKAEFRKMVVDLMVNDAILMDYAAKHFAQPAEEEIDAFISSLEESNKMKKGDLSKHLKENYNVSNSIFRHKMKVEAARAKIIREVLSQKLNVENKDVESLVLDTNHKDANLELQMLTSINNKDLTYRRLEGMRNKIKNCSSLKRIRYQHIAKLEHMNIKLSSLPVNIQTIVKNLPIGEPSDVIVDEAFKIVVVCQRSLNEFTAQDNYNMLNFIGNKKVMNESQKFFQDLRKKAYVKIMQ